MQAVRNVQTIRCVGAGLLTSTMQYNSLAISCLGFVSQLGHVPGDVLAKEARTLQLLTRGPYVTCDSLDSWVVALLLVKYSFHRPLRAGQFLISHPLPVVICLCCGVPFVFANCAKRRHLGLLPLGFGAAFSFLTSTASQI